MIIYCMSDIHGCLAEFEYALSLVMDHLEREDTKLILLGDYIHGPDSYGVLNKIIGLQREWGSDKVVALMGNHEDMVCSGRAGIGEVNFSNDDYDDEKDDFYIDWMMELPRYHVEGNTIFVHAGIDEEAGEMWELGTDDYTFTEKYPAELGKFDGDIMIVAGHIHTSEIAENISFNDIYFDGESHYYIDGNVLVSGVIPVMKVDTNTNNNKYYRITESGEAIVTPYDEDY